MEDYPDGGRSRHHQSVLPALDQIRAARGRGVGQVVLVVETDSDPLQERRQIASLLAQTEGLIIASSRLPDSELRHLAEDARIVLINNDTSGLARVLISSRIALSEGIQHLATGGVERICYVGGPSQSWSERERRSTVIDTAQRLSLTISLLRSESGTYAEARRLTDEVIASGAQAVVAFDDVIAHGVMDGLDDHGLRVPDTLRILGCDDALPIETRPRLSTIRLQSGAAIKAAIGLLSKSEQQVPEERVEIPGELQLRETT